LIKLLHWDSDFFGFPTGRVFLEDALKTGAKSLLAHLQNQNIKLLYLFHDLSTEVDSVQKSDLIQIMGARLVDARIVYGKDLSTISKTSLPETIFEYTLPKATNRLYDIALESGVYSRFRLDPKIPTGSYDRMYRIWLDNSVNRKIADMVLVSKDEAGAINGMVTLSTQAETAVIGLIATHADARGKGVGSHLMQAAEHYALQSGKTRLTVATQKANEPACRFYSKAGYQVASEVEVFHWWASG
jgi:dTDP-4-amino-4,6-dideoxy-D-galactose acyltransferase